MGLLVKTVAAGGLPVADVTATTPAWGVPVTESTNGYGVPVTKVTLPQQGLPVTFVDGVAALGTPATFDGTPSNVTMSGDDLTVTWGATSGGVASLSEYSTGKFFMEFTYGGAGAPNGAVGIKQSSVPANQVGTHAGAVAYQGTSPGNILANSVVVGNIGVPAIGDVIGMAVDLNNSRIWLRRNAGLWNNSASANPATGVDGLSFASALYAPGVSFGAGGSARTITGNFGASAFAFTPPANFTPGWSA